MRNVSEDALVRDHPDPPITLWLGIRHFYPGQVGVREGGARGELKTENGEKLRYVVATRMPPTIRIPRPPVHNYGAVMAYHTLEEALATPADELKPPMLADDKVFIIRLSSNRYSVLYRWNRRLREWRRVR